MAGRIDIIAVRGTGARRVQRLGEAFGWRLHLAGFERGQHIPERNYQSHRFSRTRIEAERNIEFSRLP